MRTRVGHWIDQRQAVTRRGTGVTKMRNTDLRVLSQINSSTRG
jgi:hypothetical protein